MNYFSDENKSFNSQNFFEDKGHGDENISDNGLESDDTYADLEYGRDEDATIGGGDLREGFSPSSSKDETIIMGRRKDALAWLVKLESGKVVKKIRLKEGSNLIGRDTRSEVVIDNEEVSDEHARIIKEGKDYKLIDVGSLNGTYLNGAKVTSSKKLEDEDEVKFANIKFIFKRI